jgi:hypothetical protein
VERDPEGFAAEKQIRGYFDRWRDDRTLDHIHHALYVKCREQIDHEPSPTAGVIDSQSVKSAEKRGPALTPWL